MNLFSNPISDAVAGIGNALKPILDKFIADPGAKQEAIEKMQEEINRHSEFLADKVQQQYETQLRDVQNARDLYKNNSALQRIFAVTFLLAYVLLIPAMIYVYIHYSDKMNVITGAFLGSLFTGMSLKVETICTFLFGSTESSKKKDETISELAKQ
jgi:hypothetical protein